MCSASLHFQPHNMREVTIFCSKRRTETGTWHFNAFVVSVCDVFLQLIVQLFFINIVMSPHILRRSVSCVTHRSIDRTHAISTCAISLTAHFMTSPPSSSSRGKLRYDHWNDVIISCNALVICVGIGIWSDNVVGYLYSWNLKIRAHALILFRLDFSLNCAEGQSQFSFMNLFLVLSLRIICTRVRIPPIFSQIR